MGVSVDPGAAYTLKVNRPLNFKESPPISISLASPQPKQVGSHDHHHPSYSNDQFQWGTFRWFLFLLLRIHGPAPYLSAFARSRFSFLISRISLWIVNDSNITVMTLMIIPSGFAGVGGNGENLIICYPPFLIFSTAIFPASANT